jgi:hypothetical protein
VHNLVVASGGEIKIVISEILDSYAKSSTMDKVFLMDRTKTIGASEIGQCARRMYWVKTEGQQDANYKNGWGARIRGKVMEDKFWLPAMRRRFRKNLLLAGDKQATVHDRYLSATPDGLLVDQPRDLLASLGVPDIGPSRCIMVEGKTIDPRVNLTEAKHENMLQTQVQMGLIRELTKYKPDYALISYIDASFWDDVDEYPIKFDQHTYDQMHARAVKIKTATSATELKPEGWIAGGKECEHCPFTKPCGVVRRSLPERELAADPQFSAEMTDLCLEHEQIKADMAELEIEFNTKKDEIKNRLREKGVRKIPGIVTWSPVKGRTLVDMPAFKAAAANAGVDITDYESTGEPGDMLTVRIKGQPE